MAWIVDAVLPHARHTIAYGKLLNGKIISTDASNRSAETYDGSAWTAVTAPSSDAHAQIRDTGIVMSGGDFLVTPGFGSAAYDVKSNRYNPGGDSWSVATMTGVQSYQIPGLIELNNGKVLAACVGTTPYVKGTILYDPTGDSWTAGADLSITRNAHAITKQADGKVLVIGGRDASSVILDLVEQSDATATTWTVKASLAHPRAAAVAVTLASGKVLVAGGFKTSGGFAAVLQAEIYDPNTDTWSAAGTINDARSGSHSMIALPDGRALLCGGFADGAGASLKTAEIYDPDANTWTAIDMMNARRAAFALVLYTSSPMVAFAFGSDDYDGDVTEVYLDSSERLTIAGPPPVDTSMSYWAKRLLSRFYEQFKDKTHLTALAVDVCAPQFQAIENALQQLRTLPSIDDSEGAQLDVLGIIIGQGRLGLDDATYRLYLKARIRANLSSGTLKEIYAVFYALFEILPSFFGPPQVIIRRSYAAIELTIVQTLTHIQALVGTSFLRDSKAAGVRASFRWQETDDAHAFCFDGGSGLGFDDYGSPGAGGAFAGALAAD